MTSRFTVAALAASTLLLAACGGDAEQTYQGWIEADLVFVGADEGGRVETLAVREGDSVDKGIPVFTLDSDLQQADVNVAKAVEANAEQAFARAERLLQSKAGTQKAYDETQAALREARARLSAAETRLARREVASPVAGTVQEVYYRVGEMVPAGRPVLALLPPGNLKVRFFVGEPELARIKIGDVVTVRCDGCASPISAHVSFIASSAEYTPPVIYSQQERQKLVYLVEAQPDQPQALRVGQPITVSPTDTTAVATDHAQ